MSGFGRQGDDYVLTPEQIALGVATHKEMEES